MGSAYHVLAVGVECHELAHRESESHRSPKPVTPAGVFLTGLGEGAWDYIESELKGYVEVGEGIAKWEAAEEEARVEEEDPLAHRLEWFAGADHVYVAARRCNHLPRAEPYLVAGRAKAGEFFDGRPSAFVVAGAERRGCRQRHRRHTGRRQKS